MEFPIKSDCGTISVQGLFSSVMIRTDRYSVFLKPKQLVELKNLLSDCLRSLKENKKNKVLSKWIKEKDTYYNFRRHKMTVYIPPKSLCKSYRDVGITVPLNISPSNIGITNLIVYLGLEEVNCFIRDIKNALLKIRLEKKANKK